MKVLLNRNHDIRSFASTDGSRPVLNSIHYNADKRLVEATDGRILIRVPVVVDESDQYPELSGGLGEPNDAIIPTDAYKKALSNIPKSVLPILCNMALSSNGDKGKVVLSTTDLDTQQDIRTKVIEGTYPACDQVMPQETPSLSITLAAELLDVIADYAKKNSNQNGIHHGVTFHFTDNLSAVRFEVPTESGKANGALMPMRPA